VARIFQILAKNYEALECLLHWQKYDSNESKFHPNAQWYIALIRWVSKVMQPTYWDYKNNSLITYIDFRWALYVCYLNLYLICVKNPRILQKLKYLNISVIIKKLP